MKTVRWATVLSALTGQLALMTVMLCRRGLNRWMLLMSRVWCEVGIKIEGVVCSTDWKALWDKCMMLSFSTFDASYAILTRIKSQQNVLTPQVSVLTPHSPQCVSEPVSNTVHLALLNIRSLAGRIGLIRQFNYSSWSWFDVFNWDLVG